MEFRITVRFGKLGELQGPPRKWKEITIVPALVGLSGSSFSRNHYLSEFLDRLSVPFDVRTLMLDGYDGPWVRGRMERLFQVPPETERGEKSGLQASFIALLPQGDGSLLGVPFECNDYYLRSGLMFSEVPDDCPPPELRDRLLLADPHGLRNYSDRMYHIGAGVWLIFGIENGQPFIDEFEEEPQAQ